VVAFAKSFTDRRTADERERTGIAQLTDVERAKLDALVAAEVARRPMAAYLPTPRPQPPGNVDEYKPHAEIHGQVSLFVGGSSHGGSFYGGSFDAVVIDPSRRFMVGVGMSEVRGRGLHGCYDRIGW
jgi:hypothetical protein